MKRIFLFIVCCWSVVAAFAENFYLPLVGYSRFDKTTKKTETTNAVGVCCLEGADMFVYINKTKIDCRTIDDISFDHYSDKTATLTADADVMFDCLPPVRMQIVLHFVNNVLTNIYLRGSDADYEFYLGELQS